MKMIAKLTLKGISETPISEIEFEAEETDSQDEILRKASKLIKGNLYIHCERVRE